MTKHDVYDVYDVATGRKWFKKSSLGDVTITLSVWEKNACQMHAEYLHEDSQYIVTEW